MEKSAGLRKNESTSQSPSNDPMHLLGREGTEWIRANWSRWHLLHKKRKFSQQTRSKKKRNLGMNSTFYIHVHLVPEDNGRNLSCATMRFLGFVPDQRLMLKMQIHTSVTIWNHLDHAVGLLQEEWRWCYAPRDVLRPHLKWKWCPVILNKNQGSNIGQFVLLEIKFKDLQFRSWLWPRVQIHRDIPCQVDKQENYAKSLQSLLYLCKCHSSASASHLKDVGHLSCTTFCKCRVHICPVSRDFFQWRKKPLHHSTEVEASSQCDSGWRRRGWISVSRIASPTKKTRPLNDLCSSKQRRFLVQHPS